MDEPIDLIGFMQALIDRSYRWVKDACDGLDEDQLRYQPTPESNSIAWLVWHSSRVKDRVTGRIVQEEEIWVTEGWAQRTGMDADATGVGDSPEQVASFPVTGGLLFGYADAVHDAVMRRLATVTPPSSRSQSNTSLGILGRPGMPYAGCWGTPAPMRDKSLTFAVWSRVTVGTPDRPVGSLGRVAPLAVLSPEGLVGVFGLSDLSIAQGL